MTVAGAVIFFQQLGTEDVAGHQIGRELHAPELQLQCLPERAHQQGLAQPGGALEQAVAAGQQADQQLFDHRVLADHGLGQRTAQLLQFGEKGIKAVGRHKALAGSA